MAYPIEKKLVVGVSSNALFKLENDLFLEKGVEEFRKFQLENKDVILEKGVAFPFITRFLDINKSYKEELPVEVVLLSKNSPETGIRVFNSIKNYGLDITRGVFTSGLSPFEYIPAFNISLFLSTNEDDVQKSIDAGYPAGKFLNIEVDSFENDTTELRVAFDFDGVIADDKAESVYKSTKNLNQFHEHEDKLKFEPHDPGPLADFFKKLSFFQKLETKKENQDSSYRKILKTSIITARNAPSHERAINTLSDWGVAVDEMFFMGGVDKSRILNVLKPHIYFDDQITHLDINATNIPLVHIPFGVANKKE